MYKFYFPEMFTQAHRTHEKRLGLEYAFNKLGADPVAVYSDDCQAIFTGDPSISLKPYVREILEKTDKPVVMYVWDLYDCNILRDGPFWLPFIEQLKHVASRILVPSRCTAVKVKHYAGKESYVVRAPVHVWEKPSAFSPDFLTGAVIDVMRPYPDENAGMVTRACAELGVKHIHSGTMLPWDDFRHAVAGARLLVSCYREASTGGMTLLEGYWHGVPSLLGNSNLNGAVDYLGKRACYFQWNAFNELKTAIRELLDHPSPMPPYAERRKWILNEFSEERFAQGILDTLYSLW